MELRLQDSAVEAAHIDQPGLQLTGDGEGLGPLQMLAVSLALCSASVLHAYAHEVAGVGIAGLTIAVRWGVADRPHRIDHMDTVIHWPELPEERRVPAERAVASCTIHRTLEQPPVLTTRVES